MMFEEASEKGVRRVLFWFFQYGHRGFSFFRLSNRVHDIHIPFIFKQVASTLDTFLIKHV